MTIWTVSGCDSEIADLTDGPTRRRKKRTTVFQAESRGRAQVSGRLYDTDSFPRLTDLWSEVLDFELVSVVDAELNQRGVVILERLLLVDCRNPLTGHVELRAVKVLSMESSLASTPTSAYFGFGGDRSLQVADSRLGRVELECQREPLGRLARPRLDRDCERHRSFGCQ